MRKIIPMSSEAIKNSVDIENLETEKNFLHAINLLAQKIRPSNSLILQQLYVIFNASNEKELFARCKDVKQEIEQHYTEVEKRLNELQLHFEITQKSPKDLNKRYIFSIAPLIELSYYSSKSSFNYDCSEIENILNFKILNFEYHKFRKLPDNIRDEIFKLRDKYLAEFPYGEEIEALSEQEIQTCTLLKVLETEKEKFHLDFFHGVLKEIEQRKKIVVGHGWHYQLYTQCLKIPETEKFTEKNIEFVKQRCEEYLAQFEVLENRHQELIQIERLNKKEVFERNYQQKFDEVSNYWTQPFYLQSSSTSQSNAERYFANPSSFVGMLIHNLENEDPATQLILDELGEYIIDPGLSPQEKKIELERKKTVLILFFKKLVVRLRKQNFSALQEPIESGIKLASNSDNLEFKNLALSLFPQSQNKSQKSRNESVGTISNFIIDFEKEILKNPENLKDLLNLVEDYKRSRAEKKSMKQEKKSKSSSKEGDETVNYWIDQLAKIGTNSYAAGATNLVMKGFIIRFLKSNIAELRKEQQEINDILNSDIYHQSDYDSSVNIFNENELIESIIYPFIINLLEQNSLTSGIQMASLSIRLYFRFNKFIKELSNDLIKFENSGNSQQDLGEAITHFESFIKFNKELPSFINEFFDYFEKSLKELNNSNFQSTFIKTIHETAKSYSYSEENNIETLVPLLWSNLTQNFVEIAKDRIPQQLEIFNKELIKLKSQVKDKNKQATEKLKNKKTSAEEQQIAINILPIIADFEKKQMEINGIINEITNHIQSHEDQAYHIQQSKAKLENVNDLLNELGEMTEKINELSLNFKSWYSFW